MLVSQQTAKNKVVRIRAVVANIRVHSFDLTFACYTKRTPFIETLLLARLCIWRTCLRQKFTFAETGGTEIRIASCLDSFIFRTHAEISETT